MSNTITPLHLFYRGLLARVWLLATVVLLAGLPALAEAPAPALRLGSDVWPPFTDAAGKPRVAIDLVHEALERAGREADTAIMAWSKVEPALRDGKLDGSAALWRSPERERYLLYSSPYLENRLVLVGRKGSDVAAESLAELAGKRVALVAGYAYGAEVEQARAPELVEGASDQANLDKLLAGEVDYMLVDDLLIRHVLENQRDQAEAVLAVGDTPLARRTLHFALRKDLPGAAAVVEAFDKQIRGMLSDGSYNRILRLAWIRADVDGDGQSELVLGGSRAGQSAPASGYGPLPAGLKSPQPADERYWIDGKLYPNWQNVPERYKVPVIDPTAPRGESARLFELAF